MAKIAMHFHDEPVGQALSALLTRAGHEIVSANSQAADVMVAQFGGQSPSDLIAAHPATPLIVVASTEDTGPAIEAMKLGAWDYLHEPVRGDELTVRVNRAAEHAQLLRENQSLLTRVPTDALAGQPLAEVEKKIILSTLQQFHGHRVKTASALGIGVRTLGMKLKRWREEGQLVEV